MPSPTTATAPEEKPTGTTQIKEVIIQTEQGIRRRVLYKVPATGEMELLGTVEEKEPIMEMKSSSPSTQLPKETDTQP